MAVNLLNSPKDTSYQFITYVGRPATVSISTRNDWSLYQLSMWADKNSKLNNAVQVGSVQYADQHIILSLTSSEVDQIQDSYYYIKAVKDTYTHRLVSGSVLYKTMPVTDSDLLDENGAVRTEFVIPLAVALNDTFLRRDEYFSGEFVPEVLDAAITLRINEHIEDPTPHTAYDSEDVPSFALIFENRLDYGQGQ